MEVKLALQVGSRAQKYNLTLGNAGTAANDGLNHGANYMQGMAFSTFDADNDLGSASCSAEFGSGYGFAPFVFEKGSW